MVRCDPWQTVAPLGVLSVVMARGCGLRRANACSFRGNRSHAGVASRVKAWMSTFILASNQAHAALLLPDALAAYHACVPGTPGSHDRASTSSGRLAVRNDVAQAQSCTEPS